MTGKPQDLRPRTKAFALRVICAYSQSPKSDTVAQVLGKQVLRSGTSVGADYRGASCGCSQPGFISKIGHCLKEIEETECWHEPLADSDSVAPATIAGVPDETRQLNAIFATIAKRYRDNS